MELTQPERTLNPLHRLILKLAGRPGGLNNAELRDAAGITAAQAASALHCSARHGRTLSVEHPEDKDHRRRYFTEREHADAWVAGQAPGRVEYQRHILQPKALTTPKVSKKAEKAPQGHAWRPDVGGPAKHTAGASKMAAPVSSDAAILAFNADLIQRGASPVLGVAAKYYVDPASVPRFRYGSSSGSAA